MPHDEWIEPPMKTRTPGKTVEAPLTGQATASLLPGGAFVVQFRVATVEPGARFAGRVEHITTGHASRFESSDELLTFFARVLSAAETTRSEEG